MIIATNKGGMNFEPVPAGTRVARCYSAVHIGTNAENVLGELKDINKVRLSFELPLDTKVFREENGEQPFVLSKDFTVSMHEKANLRKFTEGMLGVSLKDHEAEAFDVEELVGRECLLNIVHKDRASGEGKYALIAGASPLMKGQSCPPQVNRSVILNYSNFDRAVFDKLPDFIKAKILSSKEYAEMTRPGSLSREEAETIKALREHERSNKAEVEDFNSKDIPFD